MTLPLSVALVTIIALPAVLAADREKRLSETAMPSFTAPIMHGSLEADAVVSALKIFPAEHPLNQPITKWPLHPNSAKIVASIGAQKPLRYNPDMAFILVPPKQPRVAVEIGEYRDESDAGPYPVPDNMPIEGWPVSFQRSPETRNLSLLDVQKDKPNAGGDRHAIVVDPVAGVLYEFYTAKRTGKGWIAAQASIFDLKKVAFRPLGWTSADAAGLPIFPTVVRYDELERGVIEHAIRITVSRSRRAYVSPATHFASKLTDENLPCMGERIRLRADFDTKPFSKNVRTILEGLKTYGAIVADNGNDWAISVVPDSRIPEMHVELRKVKGADFEIVVAP